MNPSRSERVSGLLVWLLLLAGGFSTWRLADAQASNWLGPTTFWGAPSLVALVAAVLVPLVFLGMGFAWLKVPASIGIQRMMVVGLLAYHGTWFGLGPADRPAPARVQTQAPPIEAVLPVAPAAPNFALINQNLATVAGRLQRRSDLKRLEVSVAPRWNLQQMTATASAAVAEVPWSDGGLKGRWNAAVSPREERGDVSVKIEMKAELHTDTLALIRWVAQSATHRAQTPAWARFQRVRTIDAVMTALRASKGELQNTHPGLELKLSENTVHFNRHEPQKTTTGAARLTDAALFFQGELEVQLLPSEFAMGVAVVREKLYQLESRSPASLKRLEAEAVDALNAMSAGFELIER